MKRVMMSVLLTATMLLVCSCTVFQNNISTISDATITLVVNADIVTMDPKNPTADAMAIEGDRIVAIGSESEVRGAIDNYTKFYNLEGRTVVPGFIETHDHMFMSSTISVITDVAPFHTPTLAGALEKIRHTEPDSDGWIVAFGADPTLYEEKQGPTRDLLDKIFPNTPVLVFHLSGHGGYANSEALMRAGIDETTPNPTGGFFEKDDNGRLTGYLAGQPALFAVKSYPNPSPGTAIIAAIERASKGVTTSSEFGIMNAFILESLQEVTSAPDFPVRVVGALFSTAPDFEELAQLLPNYENYLLKIPFIKTWTDGSLQGGTAHLSHGYHHKDIDFTTPGLCGRGPRGW